MHARLRLLTRPRSRPGVGVGLEERGERDSSVRHSVYVCAYTYNMYVSTYMLYACLEERGEVRERACELAVVAGSLGAAPDEKLDQALDL